MFLCLLCKESNDGRQKNVAFLLVTFCLGIQGAEMMRVHGSRVPTPHMASPKLHGTLSRAKHLKRHSSQHVQQPRNYQTLVFLFEAIVACTVISSNLYEFECCLCDLF